MDTGQLREQATAHTREAAKLRKEGGVALAQRCEAVARNLRWAADEIDELAKRGVIIDINDRKKD